MAESTEAPAEGQEAQSPQDAGTQEGQDNSEQFAPILDRLQETEARFMERLEQMQQQGQQQPEGEPDPYQQQGGDPQLDAGQLAQDFYNTVGPDGQPDPAAAWQLQQFMAQAQQGQAQLAQELQSMRSQMGAEKLEQQYPELKDGEKASELLRSAEQWSQQVGQPDLARTPAVLEMVYLANQAREQAKQETPAGEDTTTVESAAGTTPEEPETPLGTRIVQAGRSTAPGADLWGA